MRQKKKNACHWWVFATFICIRAKKALPLQLFLKTYLVFMEIKITFPDGSVRSYEQGVTGYQIAESISPALARSVVS